MHCVTGRLPKVVHERQRRVVQVSLPRHTLPEFEQAQPQPVSGALPFKQPTLLEVTGDAIHAGFGYAGATGQFGYTQGALTDRELLEHTHRPADRSITQHGD